MCSVNYIPYHLEHFHEQYETESKFSIEWSVGWGYKTNKTGMNLIQVDKVSYSQVVCPKIE